MKENYFSQNVAFRLRGLALLAPLLLASAPVFAEIKCLQTHVCTAEGCNDGSYCWNPDSDSRIYEFPPATGTGQTDIPISRVHIVNPINFPKIPIPLAVKFIKCAASIYGSKYPHVAGFDETFVPGYGFASNAFNSYVKTNNIPDNSGDFRILGFTGGNHTLIYARGYQPSVYKGKNLSPRETAIMTLVHERAHQNGVNDDSQEGLNDQAGYAAVQAYELDGGAACQASNNNMVI